MAAKAEGEAVMAGPTDPTLSRLAKNIRNTGTGSTEVVVPLYTGGPSGEGGSLAGASWLEMNPGTIDDEHYWTNSDHVDNSHIYVLRLTGDGSNWDAGRYKICRAAGDSLECNPEWCGLAAAFGLPPADCDRACKRVSPHPGLSNTCTVGTPDSTTCICDPAGAAQRFDGSAITWSEFGDYVDFRLYVAGNHLNPLWEYRLNAPVNLIAYDNDNRVQIPPDNEKSIGAFVIVNKELGARWT